eukprot:4266653-Amphidinium_carterae.1
MPHRECTIGWWQFASSTAHPSFQHEGSGVFDRAGGSITWGNFCFGTDAGWSCAWGHPFAIYLMTCMSSLRYPRNLQAPRPLQTPKSPNFKRSQKSVTQSPKQSKTVKRR